MPEAVIGRLSMITLGVGDLDRATAFYRVVFGREPNPDYQGVAFFELPGTWLALYPRDKLAEDMGLTAAPAGFGGVTLAYNGRDRAEVEAVYARAEMAGSTPIKRPRETFWGGFSGYFADPDGHCWEIAWGPMFELGPDGGLRFRKA
jgi:catechol 2,3-dioxygenase-like lactoylglutathione lyase family enzyme